MRRFLTPSFVCSLLFLAVTVFLVLPHIAQFAAVFELPAVSESRSAGTLQVRSAAESGAETQKHPAVPPLEEPEETAAQTAPANSAEVWETPSDIAAMEAAFLAGAGGKTALGTVQERFFVNDGATDVIGRVAVRDCAEEHHPDFAALLREGANLNIKDKAEPQVLIFHTHTTEGYLPAFTGSFYEKEAARSTDPSKSVVRVGDEICTALKAHGIGYIHDTEIYDAAYDGAYARSRVKVLSYLEQYPSIQIVLDVHRDAIYLSDTAACKPTAEIGGRKAAQIMIITGVEEGPVADFPGWRDNLRFALSLQNAAQEKYEGLMKPVYFCRRKYNMDVVPCGLLLEFGSDTNTLAEAIYSGRLLGETLAELIEKYD